MPAITIEPDVLQARIAPLVTAWRPEVTLGAITPLEGGASSLTYEAQLTGADSINHIVVKIAPPGLTPTRNRDVLRQALVYNALRGAPGVRVPEVYFTDEGAPLDVPPLFAMSYIPGESFEPASKAPDEFRPPDVIRSRAMAAVAMLAALHRVDPMAVGLSEVPVRTLQEEIDYWTRPFGTVPEGFRPGSEILGERLIATMPEPLPPAILHGDYRLGNIQCEGGEINGIIDWEIWALSDPRMDLGWFAQFTNPDKTFALNARGEAPGMLSHQELVAEYETQRGAPLPDMEWFHALIRYKQAAVNVLLDKRQRGQDDPPPPDGGRPGELIRMGLNMLG